MAGVRVFVRLAGVVTALILGGCSGSANSISSAADRGRALVSASHREEVEVPLGDVFGRDSALICIVLGELGELKFSPSAAQWAHHEAIVESVEAQRHDHMFFDVHLFEVEDGGALASTLRAHRRNPNMDLDTSTGADLDACFTPNDFVRVRQGVNGLVIIRISLDGEGQ